MSKSRVIILMALGLMTLPAWAADKSLVLYLPFDEGVGTTDAGWLAGGAL